MFIETYLQLFEFRALCTLPFRSSRRLSARSLMARCASRSGVYGDELALRLLACQGLLFQASVLLVRRQVNSLP